jgi:hypothetical protein
VSVKTGIRRISTLIKGAGVMTAIVFAGLSVEYLFRAYKAGEGIQFGGFMGSLSMGLVALGIALVIGWILDGFAKD